MVISFTPAILLHWRGHSHRPSPNGWLPPPGIWIVCTTPWLSCRFMKGTLRATNPLFVIPSILAGTPAIPRGRAVDAGVFAARDARPASCQI